MNSKNLTVSCRSLEPFVLDFPNWDEDYSAILGYDLAYLRKGSNEISWQEFVSFISFYSETHGKNALLEAQKIAVVSKQLSGLKVLSLMASPTVLYKLQTKWMGPMMFPCVNSLMFPISSKQLEIRIETPLPASPLFMRSIKVFLSQLPTLIGYPVSVVHSDICDNIGKYRIELPLSRTIFSRILRFLRLVEGGKDVASELSLQQDEIRAKQSALEQSNTTLRLTAEDLRDAKEQFQLAVAGSNDGIWDWDLKTDDMFLSERWKAIMGIDEERTFSKKKDWFCHVFSEDLPGLEEAIETHIAGDSEFLNYKFRIESNGLKDPKWGLVKGKIINDEHGEPYRMAGSLSDITDFVEISKNLDYTIRSYHAVLKHSPDGALIYNEKEILSTNPAMLAFLGYSREAEIVGASLLQITDAYASFFEPKIALLRGDEESIITFLRKDGGTKEGEVSALKVQYEKKIVNCILVRDITSRRILEEKLQAIAVGTMASGIAHEINNPMAYIHSNVEFVKSELAMFKTAVQNRKMEDGEIVGIINELDAALSDTLSGSKRVRTIVKDLKSLSHSSENESVQPIDVLPIIESSIAIVQHKLGDETTLTTRFHRTPPALFSEGRLGQVILNLLINAAHAISASSRTDNEIRVSTQSTDEEVCIRIEDSGTGIPENIRAKIFDPFFTTKPAGEGTGLGLSICYNIMKRLGGDLSFETKIGVGTTFIIHLPRAPEASIEASDLSVANHHILVIDDDEKIGVMMQRLLQPTYRITYVNSALEGLSTLEEISDIDLIICDAMMPECSGYDLLDKLKMNHLEMMRHFILMTGGRLEAKRFGPYEDTFGTPVLFKPFDLDLLRSTIAKHI